MFKVKLFAFIALLLIAISVPVVTMKYSGAIFNGSTNSPSNAFTTGTLLIDTDHSVSSFIGLNNMIPGDSVTKTLQVKNTGTVGFNYTIATAAESATPSLLWVDQVNGLQIKVTGKNGVYYSGSISGLINKSSTLALATNTIENLSFQIALPETADNNFQGLAENIKFTFNATQIPGSNK
jgi:spore coat-associated protein N